MGCDMTDVVLSEQPPTVAEYIDLRAKAGWGSIDEATATRSLQGPAFTVSLRQRDRLAGFARVISDGVLFFFLTELIVDPAFRGGGHGETLMREVTGFFDRNARPGATITLVALPGREPFYERFGFVRCPHGPFGAGMHYAPAPPP
jgi:ribosomal protein S18 acetylase RimI-like enzyme